MIAHTNAYLKLRRQVQDAFDFVVLVCHAVPSLDNAIARAVVAREQLPTPHQFRSAENPEKLHYFARRYQETLGRLVLLTSFSYFEAYVKDLPAEIVKFHGGLQHMADLARLRLFRSDAHTPRDPVRQLRDREKPGKAQKYRKRLVLLEDAGYRFPSERFSAYGLRRLLDDIQNRRAGILAIIEALGFDFAGDDRTTLISIQNRRHLVAHGQEDTVKLQKAIELNRFLRALAVRIDKHVVKRFLVIDHRHLPALFSRKAEL
jgi:hypothetical protein